MAGLVFSSPYKCSRRRFLPLLRSALKKQLAKNLGFPIAVFAFAGDVPRHYKLQKGVLGKEFPLEIEGHTLIIRTGAWSPQCTSGFLVFQLPNEKFWWPNF